MRRVSAWLDPPTRDVRAQLIKELEAQERREDGARMKLAFHMEPYPGGRELPSRGKLPEGPLPGRGGRTRPCGRACRGVRARMPSCLWRHGPRWWSDHDLPSSARRAPLLPHPSFEPQGPPKHLSDALAPAAPLFDKLGSAFPSPSPPLAGRTLESVREDMADVHRRFGSSPAIMRLEGRPLYDMYDSYRWAGGVGHA